ncbi:hypothetical protein LUZ63_020362 [Rhynchospora breviuscula]|uniref:16S rRNA m7G methyltransferase n=1 Tax=Rhynchospora breviuscula TaxID=2022672 RepID=A0A9P9Z937_9POAL|nr:hypothetical protein LUZ63_020362 [Rhynchospora breviuscula]
MTATENVDPLEQEGEIAADYLEELLEIADLDGDIDMDVEGDRATVSIVGAELPELVGDQGERPPCAAAQRPGAARDRGGGPGEGLRRGGGDDSDDPVRAEGRSRRRRRRRPRVVVGRRRAEPARGRSPRGRRRRMTDPVSRETPPAPAVAAGVFSSRLPLAEAYAGLLADAGITRGLIGPRELPRLWDRHVLNSALLAEAFPTRTTVADIGSGAGLPGLAVAIARPDLHVVLVEPLLRRATFLQQVVEVLGLDTVEVVRARAEELHGTRDFPYVTARAVARLEKLAGWTLPLLSPGGDLVAMKGASAAGEVDEAAPTIQRLGGEVVGIEQYGADRVPEPVTAVRVRVGPAGARRWDAHAATGRGKRGRGSGKR